MCLCPINGTVGMNGLKHIAANSFEGISYTYLLHLVPSSNVYQNQTTSLLSTFENGSRLKGK